MTILHNAVRLCLILEIDLIKIFKWILDTQFCFLFVFIGFSVLTVGHETLHLDCDACSELCNSFPDQYTSYYNK